MKEMWTELKSNLFSLFAKVLQLERFSLHIENHFHVMFTVKQIILKSSDMLLLFFPPKNVSISVFILHYSQGLSNYYTSTVSNSRWTVSLSGSVISCNIFQ